MKSKKITQNDIINMICKIWFDEDNIIDNTGHRVYRRF
jgi:hypothetical protein